MTSMSAKSAPAISLRRSIIHSAVTPALVDMLVIYEDGTGVPDLNKLTPGLRAALTGIKTDKFGDVIKVEVKLSDKLKAMEMLARHLGMFNDKLEIAGELSLEERLMAGRNRIDAPTHGS